MDECPHKRLAHWMGGYSSNSGNGVTHTGKCRKCSASFGPFSTWEEVRIAAGRRPAVKKIISERAILEAAAERVDRLCESMAVDYNSIEQAKNAILEPITKEKS